jgi:hypothetical protein
MNRKAKENPKKPAKPDDGATAKRSRANKKPKPDRTTPDERAKLGINLTNELYAMQLKKVAAILKQEKMPIDQVRLIIRAMYERMNQLAPHICKMMLDDLIKAEIVQHGPQWDEATALSKMARHLQLDSKHMEREIDDWLMYGHGVSRRQPGPLWEPDFIVYRQYKYLRLERGWLLHVPRRESQALWKEVWRRVSQEPRVKEELEQLRQKSPQAVADFISDTQELARFYFRDDPEIKSLKNKLKARTAEK